MGQAILVGTRKGLFVLRGDESRREWTVDDPLLAGWDVFHAIKHEDDLYVGREQLGLRRDRPALERPGQDLGTQRAPHTARGQ